MCLSIMHQPPMLLPVEQVLPCNLFVFINFLASCDTRHRGRFKDVTFDIQTTSGLIRLLWKLLFVSTLSTRSCPLT